MGLREALEKRTWKKKLEQARRDSDKYIGNADKQSQYKLSGAYAQEATALVNLARLSDDDELYREASETWEYAAKAADNSFVHKDVGRMYRDLARKTKGSRKTNTKDNFEDYRHGGCLITPEQFEKLAEKNSLSPEERREWKRKLGLDDSHGLEGTLKVIIPVLAIGVGAYLLSSNITGNVISNSRLNNYNIFGTFLLLAGLFIGLFLLKSKKK